MHASHTQPHGLRAARRARVTHGGNFYALVVAVHSPHLKAVIRVRGRDSPSTAPPERTIKNEDSAASCPDDMR